MRDALRYRMMTFPRVRPMCLVVSGLYNQFMRCLILIVGTGPSILVLYECVGWSGVEWSGVEVVII